MGIEEIREKISEDDLLRSLCGNFNAVYYVDFDSNIVVPYRLGEEITRVFGKELSKYQGYEDTMDAYINQIVSHMDKEILGKVTRYDFLANQLKNQKAFCQEYRVERDGKEKYFRFKAVNLEDTDELHKGVLGFADISAEKMSHVELKNLGRKVLVVDDNEEYRLGLIKVLENDFQVLSAKNGKEALKILEEHFQEIALVMTDLNMPVMDGKELITRIVGNRYYSSIPVIVTTSSVDAGSRPGIEASIIEMGASDFMTKPYNKDVALNRAKRFVQLRESTVMLNTMERDNLTGLYSKEFFFSKADEYISSHPSEKLYLLVTDVIGLKLINERFGFAMGNEVLKVLSREGANLFEGFIFGGRIDGDKLACLIRKEEKMIILGEGIAPDMGINFPVPDVILKHAVFKVKKNNKLTSRQMYDRAIIALEKIKYQYGTYITAYDDKLRKELMEERTIVESAERSLAEGQFEVYYQPKHGLKKDKTIGAEGLVRWIHPDLGFMTPAKFIPLFEQNGFITQVDFFIFEEACKSIYHWKRNNMSVVPVSINFSRRDFDDPKLPDKLIALADKYGLDHSLLHIEITESVYTNNPEAIRKAIQKLHRKGFKIELDDFGSGYSSMEALSNLDFDIIKFDTSMLANDVPGSEKNILEFAVQLAKLLKLKIVAEGVETAAQVKRLKKLGVDYIQGYYYSKPLSRKEFEEYLENENKNN